MTKLKSYRDLEVWKKSIELAEMVYRISARFSIRGEIRPDQPGPTGGSVGAGEYRGGSGTSRNRGVSPVLGDSQRLVGGDRDLSDSGAATGTDHIRADQAPDVAGIRSWTDAQRTQTLAAIQALRDPDFPLSLTTDHWSQVTVNGVDVFHPSSGEVRSDGPEGIACWFIDTDYNQESFFVRHAYFPRRRRPLQVPQDHPQGRDR